jgi:hypothetical protein
MAAHRGLTGLDRRRGFIDFGMNDGQRAEGLLAWSAGG